MRICDIVGCERKSIARGWCAKHYQRWQKHGDPIAGGTWYASPEEAFLARTEPIVGDPGCLIWKGSTIGNGYGSLRVNGREMLAHRYAWEREHGPIPDGKVIDHTCFVRACVNVGHLRLATRAQNNQNLSGAHRGRKHDLPRGITLTQSGKYQARVKINGREINAGLFPTIERAEIAVKNCRAFYFGEYAGN